MTTQENEIDTRGFGAVLEELSGIVASKRNARLSQGLDVSAHDELLGWLNVATRAGRVVDEKND
jgi:hypothetical protein